MSAFHESGDPAAMVADCAALNSDLDLNKGEGIKNDNGPRDCAAGATEISTSALGRAHRQHDTDYAGKARANASGSARKDPLASATITVFTSDDKTLSKRYELGADGRLDKDGSASILRRGARASCARQPPRRWPLSFTACAKNQAFLYSRFSDPNLQETGIGAKGRVEVGQSRAPRKISPSRTARDGA